MTVVIPSDGELGIYGYETLFAAATEALGRAPLLGAYPLSIADINRKLRVREMLAERTGTNVLPDDFLEVDVVAVNDCPYRPVSSYGQHAYNTYSVKNAELILNPTADEEIFLRYYVRLYPLVAEETNSTLAAYPEVFLYGLLWHHSRLARDESGGAAWGAAFTSSWQDANRSDAMSRMGSVAMAPTPRVVV